MRSGKLISALNEALAGVEDPQKLVGRAIPIPAVEWAEKNGLDVQRTEFAPPGKLYIIGAVPVLWNLHDDPGPQAGEEDSRG